MFTLHLDLTLESKYCDIFWEDYLLFGEIFAMQMTEDNM
jgi:hypothetical protein